MDNENEKMDKNTPEISEMPEKGDIFEGNEARKLNGYLLDAPAVPEPAPFNDEKRQKLARIWKTVGLTVLVAVVAFMGAFAGVSYVCKTTLFSDSEFFDGFIAKWSGVRENKIEVEQISGDYVGDGIELADKALSSCVRIRVSFGAGSGSADVSSGSGVIYATPSNGKYYVVTNYHVVYSAKEIKVQAYDNEVYDARVKYLDEISDLALLEFESNKKYQAATQGNSDKAKSGQGVIIAGNPLGHGFGVSFGYISNPKRITTSNNNVPLMVLDVSVNPGNSGGGVYDSSGNLIGIVVSKASGSDVDGIGYAIPSNTVNDVIDDLLDIGYVRGRPAIGITVVSVLSDAAYEQLMNGELKDYMFDVVDKRYGIYVLESKNSKIRKGDRIIKVDGDGIAYSSDITNAIMDKKVGSVIEIVVERATSDGQNVTYTQYTLEIVLLERTAEYEKP